MNSAFCLLLALSAGAGEAAGLDAMPAGVLVECEEFVLTPDWRIEKDPAFDYSGEGYVTDRASSGFARPPISRKLRLPHAGEYHVWVRAYLGGDLPVQNPLTESRRALSVLPEEGQAVNQFVKRYTGGACTMGESAVIERGR